MQDFSSLPLAALLSPHQYPCECGLTHTTHLRYLKIGAGAISHIPEALATAGASKPFILCDQHTKAAAWDKVRASLEGAGIPYTLYAFTAKHLEPDEYAVGSLAMAFDPDCDIVMAIGSGVLNDCAKVLARAVGRESMVVATAPSMDGYASNSSSMIVDGVKTTLYNECPIAIIADTDIVSQAPMRMLWAGFGDMIAKYIAICEWRISHLVTGEPYCENIASLVRRSVKKIVDNAGRLADRDAEAIEAIMEGLVLSGLAMSYAQNSRPASGLEHYFSHLWEMMALERGQPYDLHGIQVGVGTYLSMRVLQQLMQITPSREKAEAAMASFDPEAWTQNIRRVFGKVADRILEIEEKTKKNDPAKHAARLNAILAGWDTIEAIMREELPDFSSLELLMRKLGMPVTPEDLGISAADTRDAYICSRDIRDKYLTSSLLWDIGMLSEVHP